MSQTKVSIITVVYNGAETIEQTIQSVIGQTYENIEYIIIDGASTDGTCDIVRKYRDNIAVFISEPDQGLYFAMNKGIQCATGEIVGIINSDDFYAEGAISKVVECFQKTAADVVYGNARWFDASGAGEMYACYDMDALWYQMAIPHPATFVKKEVYCKAGCFDTQYAIAADYDLVLRYYSEGKKIVHIDDVVVYFRKGGLSAKSEGVCMEEAKKIAFSYSHRSCDSEKYLTKIQRYYYFRKFQLLYFDDTQGFWAATKQNVKIYDEKDKIVIFGTGKWGRRCLEIIRDLGGMVDFFVDNNSAKWGSRESDIEVKSPGELVGYTGIVLVATFVYEDQIEKQLRNLDSQLNVQLLSVLTEHIVKEFERVMERKEV